MHHSTIGFYESNKWWWILRSVKYVEIFYPIHIPGIKNVQAANSFIFDQICKQFGECTILLLSFNNHHFKSLSWSLLSFCWTTRSPTFVYLCTCVENCRGNSIPLCSLTKETRNQCKYCRYKKCQIRSNKQRSGWTWKIKQKIWQWYPPYIDH